MNTAGITERIFTFATALVGWMRGGLGHVNIGASVIFAGMSGAAVADAGGLGAIEIKAMRDAKYDAGFAVGITAASSTIGPIIPPSLPMVIYGVVAGRLDRPAVRGRLRAGAADGGGADADGRLVCPPPRLSARRGVQLQPARVELRPRLPVAADPGADRRRHPVGRLHAHRSGDRRLRLGADPRAVRLSHADLAAVPAGLHRHHRDDGGGAVRGGRRVDLRLAARPRTGCPSSSPP